MADESRFTLGARTRSFRYAWRGVRAMLASQHNAWVHATASVAACVLGVVFGISLAEWCAVVLAIVTVWTAEALNTAFEFLCDVAAPEFHPLVAKAKDVAAGAVLIAASGALAVGLLVFGSHLVD